MILQFSLNRTDKAASNLFNNYWLFRDKDGEAIAYGRFYESRPRLSEMLPEPIELKRKYSEYYPITLDSISDAEMNNIVNMKLLPRIHFFFNCKVDDPATLLTTYRYKT